MILLQPDSKSMANRELHPKWLKKRIFDPILGILTHELRRLLQ